jgi:ATP/maltotriose-dependent transcriptional regulator MalT
MEPALAGLNCKVIQSTSDEAPGLLAYVEQHLGAHHSSDVFHVQHALSQAVAAPMAAQQRAAAKALKTAEETLKRVQEQPRRPRPSVVRVVLLKRQRA